MKILVTGATGGLGSLIVNNLLSRGFDVIATSRDHEKAKLSDFYPKVKYISYDINEVSDVNLFEYFEKPDSVIHAAWEKLNEYKNEIHITVLLENHKKFILNLMKNGLKDFNCIGTCYEYGLREGVLVEDFKPEPTVAYSIAKNLLREFLEREIVNYKMTYKWIRVFYVFGEVKGRKNLYTQLISAIQNGEKTFNMSGGEQVRDFLSSEEIADIIVRISIQNKVTGLINCCSGKPVKLKDYIIDFLKRNNYNIELNLGYYPYTDYEPMETWGDIKKMKSALSEGMEVK
jgi:nucleoside-diphosphate-sugar epimerase